MFAFQAAGKKGQRIAYHLLSWLSWSGFCPEVKILWLDSETRAFLTHTLLPSSFTVTFTK